MARRLQFGVYPLSVAGTPSGLAVGPPDDHDRIRAALQDLSSPDARVLPRTYLVDMGPDHEQSMLAGLNRQAEAGLLGHLVFGTMYDGPFDIERWRRLIRMIVTEYGSRLASLQITNEPNLTFMEGARPYVVDALVTGVLTAKEAVREQNVTLPVGFGSVPDSPVALPDFWPALARIGGPDLAAGVDFVGHNFYVDVFEDPVPAAAVPGRVEETLAELRRVHLPTAGIPASTPIRVTENGWPTGRNPLTSAVRSEERQAEVLNTVIRAVHSAGDDLNITHYMLFGLRDADSAKEDPFHQFGITRDDYSEKPAYSTFKKLVADLGSPTSV